MKNPVFEWIAVSVLSCQLLHAQDFGDGIGIAHELPGWGTWIDPDQDCRFLVAGGELSITVPGSDHGHDLAAEIHRTNAPHVVRKATGNFSVQVRVEGRFAPGDESTIKGRTGYNGAGIIIMSDKQNVATLVRAVLQRPDAKPVPYINFEIRIDEVLKRMGNTGDHPVTADGPVYLRLERRGTEILGSVSEDGIKWDALESKEIPEEWPDELSTGPVAISTSKANFKPKFSELKFLTSEKPEP